jgi:hypothetical protein
MREEEVHLTAGTGATLSPIERKIVGFHIDPIPVNKGMTVDDIFVRLMSGFSIIPTVVPIRNMPDAGVAQVGEVILPCIVWIKPIFEGEQTTQSGQAVH